MIYRFAEPEDGLEMLRLMESHSASGGMRILYTRRPDAYESYAAECGDAEMILCVKENHHVLAQVVCLPRKLYINGEEQTVGYVTGLHKEDGVLVDIMKMLLKGKVQSSAEQFFCSILDDNKTAYELFAKRKLIHPVCDYTTYFLHPAALKTSKHHFRFRRAVPDDTQRLLKFYNEKGSEYSYFPVFKTMHDFAGLTVSDFFLLENDDGIIAAGALWDQRMYKQYIALDYSGIYSLAAHCNPLLRLLRYPPLPKKNTAAHFAYISFLLYEKGNLDAARVFLGEIAAVARSYDFLTIGAAREDELGSILNAVKSIKIGSRLCIMDYDKNSPVPIYETPFRFECALL